MQLSEMLFVVAVVIVFAGLMAGGEHKAPGADPQPQAQTVEDAGVEKRVVGYEGKIVTKAASPDEARHPSVQTIPGTAGIDPFPAGQ